VKKAVGAILKIAHAEPITEPMLGINDEQGEQQQLITSSKFNLLDPLKVLEIFKRINLQVIYVKNFIILILFQDLPLLMIGADELKHPVNFLTQRIPVPPVCIRPSVK
jgi:DNA-directed RNA polymerase beta' subunit